MKKTYTLLLATIMAIGILVVNGCGVGLNLLSPYNREEPTQTEEAVGTEKAAEKESVLESLDEPSPTPTVNDEKRDIRDCNDSLAMLGYYFSSVEEAVNYFEEAYENTGNERDFVDLCICLIKSNRMESKKEKYFAKMDDLLSDDEIELVGFGYEAIGVYYADYALMQIEKNSADCIDIMQEYAQKAPNKAIYYLEFYIRLTQRESLITESLKNEYKLIKEVYNEFDKLDDVTFVTKQVFCNFMYTSAVSLGYDKDARRFSDEYTDRNEYYEKNEDEINDQIYNQTYIDDLDRFGFYFYQDEWYFLVEEYKQTGNQRALADACLILSHCCSDYHYNIRESFPDLLSILDQQGYVTGIGTADVDRMYALYVWAFVDMNSFRDEFQTYIEKANSKMAFVEELLSEMLYYFIDPDFDDLEFVYNEGVRLLNEVEGKQDTLSNYEKNSYLNLLGTVNYASSLYTDLAKYKPSIQTGNTV